MCMVSHFSRVQLFVTLWTVAHQAPLSVGFSRQGYWSGLLCPPLGDLPGIEPASLTSTHDYWKNNSFDYTDLCQKCNVSAF